MRYYLLRKNVSFQVNKIIMKYFLINIFILFFSNLYAEEFKYKVVKKMFENVTQITVM